MLHNSLTTSQRFISYLLSLFDVQSYSQQLQQQQQYYDQSPLLSSSSLSSSSYFLNDSIVMVQRRSNKFNYQSDPWSLHGWLKGLSKHVLYQLLIDMRPRLEWYGSLVATGTAATSSSSSPSKKSSAIDDSMISSRLSNDMSSLRYLTLKSSSPSIALNPPSTLTMIRQVLLIQQHAREIVHQLDHLRPSEQFAKARMTAHALHQLVRLSADTLRPHSILALLSMLTIVQELLDASSSELRRHVFYRSKWGRTVVLEMTTILKTFTLPTSPSSPLPFNHDTTTLHSSSSSATITISNSSSNHHHLKKWSTYLIACLNPPTVANEEGWVLDWLELICTSMAKYDPRWKYKHEYQDVVQMAKECF